MKYYTCANTSAGFYDFTGDNVFDAERIIELKSTNQYITDRVLQCFCEKLAEPFDEILAPGTENLKSGIITGDRSLALVSGFGYSSETIELDELPGLNEYSWSGMPQGMQRAYKSAKEIHDDWEKIYIENMDFARLDSYCENIIFSLVKKESNSGRGRVYKRFFGTTTTEGPVNYIDAVTEGLSERYFIKGRPGTGKSTFLKKLSEALTEKEFDVEQYYCSFDPLSLDMVVSRELSFCVFDSTAPHEKFPEREGDVILDFYEEAGLSGIDEKYANELSFIKNAYDAKIKEGNEAFKDAFAGEMESKFNALKKMGDEDILKVVQKINKLAEYKMI